MSETNRATDLNAVIAAYSTLSVEFGASPHEIHATYRTLAQRHHPDRLAASASPAERQEATRRMAELNAAYTLIRDAPLRSHPISRGPVDDWADAQTTFEKTIKDAHRRRRWQQVGAAVALGALVLLAIVFEGPALRHVSYPVGVAIMVLVTIIWTSTAGRSIRLFAAIDNVLWALRLLTGR